LFSFLINTIKIICPHIYQAKGATVDFCFQLISLRSGVQHFISFIFIRLCRHSYIYSIGCIKSWEQKALASENAMKSRWIGWLVAMSLSSNWLN